MPRCLLLRSTTARNEEYMNKLENIFRDSLLSGINKKFLRNLSTKSFLRKSLFLSLVIVLNSFVSSKMIVLVALYHHNHRPSSRCRLLVTS